MKTHESDEARVTTDRVGTGALARPARAQFARALCVSFCVPGLHKNL